MLAFSASVWNYRTEDTGFLETFRLYDTVWSKKLPFRVGNYKSENFEVLAWGVIRVSI